MQSGRLSVYVYLAALCCVSCPIVVAGFSYTSMQPPAWHPSEWSMNAVSSVFSVNPEWHAGVASHRCKKQAVLATEVFVAEVALDWLRACCTATETEWQ
jgi:hypothetical protein